MLNNIDLVIITALPIERDAVLSRLDDYKLEPNGAYYTGKIGEYNVIVSLLIEMGNKESGIIAAQLLERFKPKNIIMLGIAAGNPDKVNLGDVVIANFCNYYELAKLTPDGKQTNYRHLSTSINLFRSMKNYDTVDWYNEIKIARPNKDELNNPQLHFGPISSGEKVIADNITFAELLQDCPKLLAAAMEGAGVARATMFYDDSNFIEIRGICDFANPEKNDDWHEYAANAAATFLVAWIKNGGLPFKSKKDITQNKPDHLLFYSPDRTPQKEELKDVIDTYQTEYSDKKQRPVLCLIHGNRNEYGNFFEYLIKYFLPNDSNLSKYFSNSICDIKISFRENFYMEKFHTIEKLHQEILTSFKNDSKIKTNKKEIIAKKLSKERRPIVIYLRLSAKDFKNWQDQKTIIDGFIDFWADWPKNIYAQQQLFLVFLSVNYTPEKPVKKLLFWKKQPTTNSILLNQFETLNKDYPTIIDFFDNKNIHARVFPKLESVPIQAIHNWLTHCKELQLLCNDTYILENQIETLYENKDAIPMDDLVIELKKLLNIPKY